MLPGDSMLFATGLLTSHGDLNILVLLGVFVAAAIGGYAFNFRVGGKLGAWLLEKHGGRFIKREYLIRTHAFFEKRGGKTILIARFVPIVRTFAPFVAGLVKMNHRHFFLYNVLGGFLWILTLVGGGYCFGNVPLVRDHFTVVVFGIIFVSLWPVFFEVLRKKQA
jgi:membrane-associated protein